MSEDFRLKMQAKLDALNNKKGSQKKNDDRYFKPEEGEQIIRILPSPDMDHFKEYWFHYGLGKTVMCAKKTFNEKCPICEYGSSLWASGTDEDKKLAKQFFSKPRYYSNVVVRGKESEGSKLYGYGKEVYGKLLRHSLDPDIGDFTDVDEGRDLVLTYSKASGASFPTSDIFLKTKLTPLAKSKKEISEIMNKMSTIDSFFERTSYEDAQNVLKQFLESDDPADPESTKYGTTTLEKKSTDLIDEKLNELMSDDDE